MINVIKSIGVELEGFTPKNFDENIISFLKSRYPSLRDIEIHGDGSLEASNYNDWSLELTFWTPVSDYKKTAELFGKIFDDLSKNFGFYQNSSCGNHMHLKFSRKIFYFILSLPSSIYQYQSAYKETYKNNRKYLRRLQNRYSREYINLDEINNNQQFYDRYYAINFCSLDKHSNDTVEIRVMPNADNKEEYRNMVLFNLETIDKIVWQQYNYFKKIGMKTHGVLLKLPNYVINTNDTKMSLWYHVISNIKEQSIMKVLQKYSENYKLLKIYKANNNEYRVQLPRPIIEEFFREFINNGIMYWDVYNNRYSIKDGHREEVINYIIEKLQIPSQEVEEQNLKNSNALLYLRYADVYIDIDLMLFIFKYIKKFLEIAKTYNHNLQFYQFR